MTKLVHIYYLAEAYDSNLHTASIVRIDNENILQQLGFAALKFKNVKDGSVIVKLRRMSELVKLVLSVKKDSLVVFHFPFLASAYSVLLRLLNKRGVKTVAIIIDIDGLRYNDDTLLKKELATLKMFDHIIAHNDAMKLFLAQHIPAKNIYTIELFDYPVTKNVIEKKLTNNICFAGNLEKSSFVYSLKDLPGLHFNLYGPSYAAGGETNISYQGVFSPASLPTKLEGSFGLVWDGSSLTTCDEYLQYNNPHKLSLYLAAGMPVIVWKQSAVANFVEENNIGITVDSLMEIESKIKAVTPEQYASMKNSIKPLQNKLINGGFLSRVITEILEQ